MPQSWENSEALKTAITDVCSSISDSEWDADKLQEKIWQYFRKGGKQLEVDNNDKTWQDLVHDYADIVFNAIFSACGDREWINTVDFLLCLDAGCKFSFPKWALKKVEQTEFEQACLAAYERSWDENRTGTILWDAVENHVPKEGQAPKKIGHIAQNSRAKAYKIIAESKLSSDVTQHFLATWIAEAIKSLAEKVDPAEYWPQETAAQFFQSIIDNGGLPSAMVETHGAPPEGSVEMFLNEAYAAAADESGATVVSMAVKEKPQKAKKKAAAKTPAAAWGGEDEMGWGKAAWGGKGGAWPMMGGMKGGMKGKGDMWGGKAAMMGGYGKGGMMAGFGKGAWGW